MRLSVRPLALATVLCATGLAYAQTAAPVVSDVRLSHVTSTSAVITFSSGAPSFAGVSYQIVGGSWTTINERYGVDHSVTLNGLNPDSQYNYIAWASGAPKMPTASFRTASSSGATSATSSGSESGAAGNTAQATTSYTLPIVGGIVVVLLIAFFILRWFVRRRSALKQVPPIAARRMARAENAPDTIVQTARIIHVESFRNDEHRDTPESPGAFLGSGIKTAVEVDAELVRRAQEQTGISDKTALVAQALELLIHMEDAKQKSPRAVPGQTMEGGRQTTSRMKA